MKKSSAPLALFLAFLALSGCATMFSDSSDPISIDSEPQGATVTIGNNVLCRTPCHVDMPRRTDATYIVLKKDGYQTKTAILEKTIAPAAWWNLGFITTTSGGTSWGIDAATGKLFKYNPNSYIIELDKKTASLDGVSPLEYTLENFDRLKVEISRENGETYDGLCFSYHLNPSQCQSFESRIHGSKTELMNSPHGVAMYRKLKSFL